MSTGQNIEDPLENSSRRDIYSFIERNDGATFSDLKKGLGYNNGALDYHLTFLMHAGLIAKRVEGRKRFYCSTIKPSPLA